MTTMNDAERAGFEAVYGTIKPEDHATGDDQAIYELERMAFQAGAAWQRAQWAGVPDITRKVFEALLAAQKSIFQYRYLNDEMYELFEVSVRGQDALRAMLAAAPAHPAERQEQGEVQRLREALDHIVGLSRALRVGGPDPMDLEGLSNAIEEAVDTAHAALAASTGQEVEK